MNFKEYIAGIQGKTSVVKHKILERLWAEGKDFPRGWVRSSELLDLTGQKYFDRRVRELRDEDGCDIEQGTLAGKHVYRLVSTSMEISNPRAYLTASQKKGLFEAANNRCAVLSLIHI